MDLTQPYTSMFFLQGKNSIVVVTKSYDKDPPQYRLHAIRNDLYTDTCFLKVIGELTGICIKELLLGVKLTTILLFVL